MNLNEFGIQSKTILGELECGNWTKIERFWKRCLFHCADFVEERREVGQLGWNTLNQGARVSKSDEFCLLPVSGDARETDSEQS